MLDTTKTIATRTLVRDMPNRSRIVATLTIDHLGGNQHPHFSATGNVWEAGMKVSGAARSRRRPDDPDVCGMVHDEILRAFPGAAPFLAMHLSDWPSGEPMHALANGWYFASGRAVAYDLEQYGAEYVERHGSGLDRAARTLRCSPEEIPVYGTPSTPAGEDAPTKFIAFVDAQRDRWAREAQDARALLDRMPDVFALRGYDIYGEPVERVPLPEWLIGSAPEFVDV